MNKQKFVEYLRSPESISASQFEELEQLLVDYPYFSIAKSMAARASKNLNSDKRNDLIASAAIYATDRRHLKRYVNGEVIFLSDTPKIENEPKTKTEKSPIPEKADEVKKEVPMSTIAPASVKSDKMEPVHTDVDQILDELHRDMEELKKSRQHFVEIQNQLDDEGPIRPITKSEEKIVEEDASESKVEEKKITDEVKEDSDTNITNLIDSLKKEFAEEEADSPKSPKKEEAKTPISEPKKKEEKPKKAAKSKAKKVASEEVKPQLKESEKLKVKETSKPEPSKKDKASIVTNMDESDEDQETAPLDPKEKPESVESGKKAPARSNRGSRQKIKREELERIMGVSIKTTDPKESKAEIKKVEKEEEKSASKKKTPKKKAVAKKEIKAPAAKKTVTKKAANKTVSKKEEPKPPTKEKQKVSKPEAPTTSKEDTSSRSSAKAFKDFGGTGDMSSSVSRASSSKRKRSSRSSKSSSDSGEKKGGDDDKSGPSDLIEKFIKENPSIQRRTLKGDKSDLSEKSTEWQTDIASEYLAEIYLKQGNKQRAIQIYEALILKFPEKKSYFAALIEKVQG